MKKSRHAQRNLKENIGGILLGKIPFLKNQLGPSKNKQVGGWTTHLKNMRKSNWIISPGIGVNIKNIWNHHLARDFDSA